MQAGRKALRILAVFSPVVRRRSISGYIGFVPCGAWWFIMILTADGSDLFALLHTLRDTDSLQYDR